MPATLHLLDVPHLMLPGGRVDLPRSLPGFVVIFLGHAADWVPRERLMAMLWPDATPPEAQHNLRVNLLRARQWLASHDLGNRLEAERTRVRLRIDCDVSTLRALLGHGEWSGALAAQRGPFASGLALPGFPAADEWLETERRALTSVLRDAALHDGEQRSRRGDAGGAFRVLDQRLGQDSLAEELLQSLLRVAEAAGQRTRALAHFDLFRERLAREQGDEPLPETLRLATALRQAMPSPRPRPQAQAQAAIGAGAVPSVLDRPPLVGREHELGLLREPWARLAFVAGEPGVGKSALLAQAEPTAAWIACREGFSHFALRPLVDFIDDQLEALREHAVFASHRLEMARLVPHAAPTELPPPPDPARGSAPLLAALCDVLESLGRPLVFDDLQWADATTLALLQQLMARGVARLRCAWRSSDETAALKCLLDRFGEGPSVVVIRLQPLSSENLATLVAQLDGQGQAAPRFAAWLHERTTGNPLFALEMLRMLFESGQLRGHASGWSSAVDAMTRDYNELPVPARVQTLVRQRVNALAEPVRRALALVAVLGRAEPLDLLAAVLAEPPLALAGALASAEGAGLLRAQRFSHDLLRQTVYRDLPDVLRAALHAAVARCGGGLLDAEELAGHWWQAGLAGPAVDATLDAARSLRRRGLHGAAATALERALGQTQDPPLRASLLASLARTHLEQGALDHAEAQAALALRELPLPVARGHALLVQAAVRIERGALADAQQLLDEVEACAPDLHELLIYRAYASEGQGRLGGLIDALKLRLARQRTEPPGVELIEILTSLGALHDRTDQYARGEAYHLEAWQVAERLGAPFAQVDVATNLVWCYSGQGSAVAAIAIAERGLALGDFISTPTLRNNLAWIHWHRGELDLARRLYEANVAHGSATLRAIGCAKLIEIHASQQRPEAMRLAIDQGLLAAAATETLSSRVAVVVSVLHHGSDADVQRALVFLPATPPSDEWSRARLAAALAARGVEPPAGR